MSKTPHFLNSHAEQEDESDQYKVGFIAVIWEGGLLIFLDVKRRSRVNKRYDIGLGRSG